MFILLVSYTKPLEIIEQHLQAHRAFLDKHFAVGTLICSGPQVPRTGGVILAKAESRAAVEALIREDPFAIHGVAEYAIIEFAPNKFASGVEAFIQ